MQMSIYMLKIQKLTIKFSWTIYLVLTPDQTTPSSSFNLLKVGLIEWFNMILMEIQLVLLKTKKLEKLWNCLTWK